MLLCTTKKQRIVQESKILPRIRSMGSERSG